MNPRPPTPIYASVSRPFASGQSRFLVDQDNDLAAYQRTPAAPHDHRAVRTRTKRESAAQRPLDKSARVEVIRKLCGDGTVVPAILIGLECENTDEQHRAILGYDFRHSAAS